MELRVRDVYFNIEQKGKLTLKEINNKGVQRCKASFQIGNNTCGERSCEGCYNMEMKDLEEEDSDAIDIQRQWDEENEDDDYDDDDDRDEHEDEDGYYDDDGDWIYGERPDED